MFRISIIFQACVPTFHSLSPLRQSMSNPDMAEAASVVLSFHPAETAGSHGIEFPVEEQGIYSVLS